MSNAIVKNLTTEQQGKLKKVLKDISDSRARSEAESEFVSGAVKKAAEELKLPKKLIATMAKVYHKQNFDEVVAENDEFEQTYKAVVE